MATIKTHIEDCEAVLGKGYEEVHRWMDHFAKKWNPFLYLEYHRQFRHHAKAVEYVREKWGHYAEIAAKLHIIRDNDMYVYIPNGIQLLREDQIDEYYQQAIKYCHPLPTNEDWKKDEI